MRPNPVKCSLKAGKPAVGTWLSLGSITAARFLARAGFAWLTVDIEHSLVDWETATHMFAVDRRRRLHAAGPRAGQPPRPHQARARQRRPRHRRADGQHPRRRPRPPSPPCLYPPRRQPQRRRQRPRPQLRRHRRRLLRPRQRRDAHRAPVRAHPGGRGRRRRSSRCRASTPSSSAPTTWRPACAARTASRRRPRRFKQALTHILATCKKHNVAAGIHCVQRRGGEAADRGGLAVPRHRQRAADDARRRRAPRRTDSG